MQISSRFTIAVHRIHSHCGYLSPNEYERVYEQESEKIERLAG